MVVRFKIKSFKNVFHTLYCVQAIERGTLAIKQVLSSVLEFL